MDVVQSVAVAAANVVVPGSGVLVNTTFELSKICLQIGLVLSGMEESAASLKAHRENIEEDVEKFTYMVRLVNDHVGDQTTFSEQLQNTILRFESDVTEYNGAVNKFKHKSILNQLIFRSKIDEASQRTNKTLEKLEKRLILECSIDGSSHRRPQSQSDIVPQLHLPQLHKCRQLSASDGSLFLSDESRIFQMTDGSNAVLYSGSLESDLQNGARASARYDAPRVLAVSSGGDLFICDYGNAVVRRITSGTTVSTFSSFTASDMWGIAVDSSGNVFVTLSSSNKVTKITSAGVSSTFTSSTTTPMGITVDSSGNLYMTDAHAVKKITSSGVISTLAGSTSYGFANGVGTAAMFSSPKAITIGSDGNLYVADTGNNCIRKVALATNTVTTYAGVCTSSGSTDGAATTALFSSPRGIAATTSSVFYVVDGGNSQERVRKIYVG